MAVLVTDRGNITPPDRMAGLRVLPPDPLARSLAGTPPPRPVRLRRSCVVGLGLLVAIELVIAQPTPLQIPVGNISIGLDLVASGLVQPVYATHAGDGSGRLFVVDQVGLIRIIADGVLLDDPFLDLRTDIPPLNQAFDARGLFGLAFHPDYVQNGRFFVLHSALRVGAPGEPCFGTPFGCHEEVLAEYSVSADPNAANPVGEILFRVDQPQFDHNSTTVAFGPPPAERWTTTPAQLLYFGLGDGGSPHDGLADSPPSHGPIGHGQNVETPFGAILRIDVDSPPAPGKAYAIPGDNPFVGRPGLDEIFAYGLRNPYRFSFDDGPGGDGRLFLGDPGQALIEEVDIVERGGNYGWAFREGTSCFDPLNPLSPPATCRAVGPSGEPLIEPVAAYGRPDGSAVIGGFVYRGSRFPELVGKYVFGDFSEPTFTTGGRLFWIDTDGDLSQIVAFRGGRVGAFVIGFGEDEEGEIYVLTSETPGLGDLSGKVFHIVP